MAKDEDMADFPRSGGSNEETTESLLTAASAAAMRESLEALAALSGPGAQPQIVRSGETSLEGLVRDMLRPMLAEWLDKNLPAMVERMVAAEIARIVRKKG
jgi:cell pole-organizing protein PopZ